MIETTGLCKRYGKKLALADLELSVRAGEVFGFIGPNGAGKTTTIPLLLDLIRPSCGSVSVLGLDPRRQGVALRRRVGYLPGELGLYEDLTGRELLRWLAGLRGGAGEGAIQPLAQRKTIGLLLANPVSRTGVVLEKAAAAGGGVLALGVFLSVALVAGADLIGMHISSGHLVATGLSVVLLGLLFGALALALSCATGARGATRGIAPALAVAAYFLNSLAPLVSSLKPYRKLSPFYWYTGHDPLREGLSVAHGVTLAGVTLLLVAAAVLAFNRRDLSV